MIASRIAVCRCRNKKHVLHESTLLVVSNRHNEQIVFALLRLRETIMHHPRVRERSLYNVLHNSRYANQCLNLARAERAM
jgi:hypothetical protein